MEGILVPLGLFGGLFATIVLISYYKIRKTERLALIAADKEAGIFKESDNKSSSHTSLKIGIFMVGIAIGLLVGEILAKVTNLNPEVAYLSMVLIFGGISLVIYYLIEKRLKKKF